MIIKSSFRRVRPLARSQKVKESQNDAGAQLLGRPGSGGRRRVVCVLPGGGPEAPERECEERGQLIGCDCSSEQRWGGLFFWTGGKGAMGD